MPFDQLAEINGYHEGYFGVALGPNGRRARESISDLRVQ